MPFERRCLASVPGSPTPWAARRLRARGSARSALNDSWPDPGTCSTHRDLTFACGEADPEGRSGVTSTSPCEWNSAASRGVAQNRESLAHVVQLRYTARMKTTTIPSIRVEPDFRVEVEAVLAEGETLSQFVEASVRASVERRRMQAEFIARGLRSRDEARRTGDYVDADVVIDGLQRKLDAARTRLAKKGK